MNYPFPSIISQYTQDFSSVFIQDELLNGNKTKTDKFYYDRGRWLLGAYMNNLTSIRYTDLPNYIESRLYGQGKQPNIKYMDYLCPRVNKDGKAHGKRKSWMNISWDIFPAFVRIRQKVLGYMLNYDYYISAQCNDEMSDADRNELKLKLRLKQQHNDFMSFMEEYLGTPDQNQSQLPFTPKSVQEIEMIDQMGGFKLWQEIAMENFCKRSFTMSNWDEIQKQLKEDIIDLGLCITKDYLDPVTFRPKIRYCDPQYTVIRHSIDPSSRDVTEAGEIKFYTAADLLRKYPAITKERMLDAIQANKMEWGNNRYNFNSTYNGWNETMNMAKIAVFEFEFVNMDSAKYKIEPNQYGGEIAKQAPVGYDGKDAKVTYEPNWYEACWIIGTNIVYNQGRRQNAPYTWNSENCNSSYTMYRAGERSIVDICKSTIDSLQINVYKTRNAEIKAAPNGVAIDWSTLLGMTHGGKKLEPFDILKIRQDTGNLLFKGRTTAAGQPLQGGANPITAIDGGIGQHLTELITLNMKYMNDLRDLTGFPALIDATNSGGQQGLGVTEIAQQAAADVIRPALFAFKDVKKRVTENICMRWQMLALFHPEIVKSFAREVGDVWTDILQLGSEFAFYKYGISFEAEVSPMLIADVKQAALVSMQAGKAGQPGISMADYMFILRQLETGNLKFAEMYLAYAEEKSYQQQAKMQEQNMAMNAKSAQDLEAAKAQSQGQVLEATMVQQDHLITAKAAADSQLSAQDAKQKSMLQAQQAAEDKILQEAKYNREMELQAAAPKPVKSSK